MPTYSNIVYDVWGNEDDGFEVNDTRNVGKVDVHLAASTEIAVASAGYYPPVMDSDEPSVIVSLHDEGIIEFEEAVGGRPVGRLIAEDVPERPAGKPFARVVLEVSARMHPNRKKVRVPGTSQLHDVVLEYFHKEPPTPGELPLFFVGIRDSQPERRSTEAVDFFDVGVSQDLDDHTVGGVGVDAVGNEVIIKRDGADERLAYLMVALDRWFETGGEATTEMRWA